MINSVTLIGRLTKSLEVKLISNGNVSARFTLAVQESFKSKNGEYATNFISCVIFGKAASNLAQHTQTGSLIAVDGRLKTGSYDNKQGQKVYTTDVIVEEFNLLESKSKTNNNSNPQQSEAYTNAFDSGIEISDEDMPF